MRRLEAKPETVAAAIRAQIVFDRWPSNGAVDFTANARFLEPGIVHRRKVKLNVGLTRAEGLNEGRQETVGRVPIGSIVDRWSSPYEGKSRCG
jgi:hypothetical protein